VTALLAVLVGLLGLAVGSFLNVVVYRVPLGESVVRPRSHCPGCGAGIRPRDEIPVASWVLLRGRCRDCGTRISIRYPVVELTTGLLFALLAIRFGASWELPAYLYLAAVGVALAAIDLDTKRLPDRLTLPSYPVAVVLLGVAALAGDAPGDLVRALLGMVALGGAYFLLAFIYPAGMGLGDVKLAGVLGLYLAYLGWGTLVVGFAAGFLLGGVFAIALLVAGRAGRKTGIPFGPFMIAGAFVAVFFGTALASAYNSAWSL